MLDSVGGPGVVSSRIGRNAPSHHVSHAWHHGTYLAFLTHLDLYAEHGLEVRGVSWDPTNIVSDSKNSRRVCRTSGQQLTAV